MIRRLAVVGLGLLGGSVAKAARADGLAREIVGVGRHPEALEPARRDGTVDRVTTDLRQGLDGADFCVLAVPVAVLEGLLPAAWEALPGDAVLTDVGSTKARIVATADRLGGSRPVHFVGGHPMAGSHRSGYAAARKDLFHGATVILTPTDRTDPAALKRVSGFWEALGARITTMEPGTHDRAVAAVSHLPHLIADALIEAVVRMDPAFLEVAGRGFLDTTRIAAASPVVWREIFQDNRAALQAATTSFREALDHLERLIADDDHQRLERTLARIKQVRERLG